MLDQGRRHELRECETVAQVSCGISQMHLETYRQHLVPHIMAKAVVDVQYCKLPEVLVFDVELHFETMP